MGAVSIGDGAFRRDRTRLIPARYWETDVGSLIGLNDCLRWYVYLAPPFLSRPFFLSALLPRPSLPPCLPRRPLTTWRSCSQLEVMVCGWWADSATAEGEIRLWPLWPERMRWIHLLPVWWEARGGEEAGEPVCAVPGRPAPPTKSAVSVTRVSDSRGERGEDRRGMGGRGGWRRRRWKGGMG